MSETLNLARLKKGTDVFEIVINPEQAVYFRHHLETNVREALAYPKIYSDAKKGLLASEQRMQAIFGTTDPLEIAKQIIIKGDIQITAEYRKQLLEQKRKRIIDIIRRQGVDPRTNSPHPLTRIEAALAEAKVRIDEFKTPELQVPEILKALRPIIPIKLVMKEIEVVVPAQYAPKAYPFIKSFGKIIKEHWKSDGSWNGKIEIPGGLETEFYDKLNSITRGQAQTTHVTTKGETI
ncbi:MAG: ribosome assembly factor SBDS [Candidatus Woesearchaeota archaeon]